MRYIFISDVHGEYDKMIAALEKECFNPQLDTLVSLGDLFDRGPKSKEVLQYIMGLPHKICIWGNHDMRLRELMLGYQHEIFDNSNGIPATLQSFCGLEKRPSIFWGIQLLRSDETLKDIRNLLWNYFDSCYYAIEFPDLIGVHCWVPYDIQIVNIYNSLQDKYTYKKDWRTAHNNDWSEYVWGHTEHLIRKGAFPEKNMIVGHWHAWRIAEYTGEKRTVDNLHFNCATYFYSYHNNQLICIDGFSNYEHGGVVNTFSYVSDAEPILYHN